MSDLRILSIKDFCGSKPVLPAPKRGFRSTPNNGHCQTDLVGPFDATSGLMHRSKVKLSFNHLVGAGEEYRRQIKPNLLGCLCVDD